MPFQWLWIGVISTREDVTCLWQVEEGKQDYVDTCFTAKVKTGKCVFYWKWAENVSFVYVCEEKQTHWNMCRYISLLVLCVWVSWNVLVKESGTFSAWWWSASLASLVRRPPFASLMGPQLYTDPIGSFGPVCRDKMWKRSKMAVYPSSSGPDCRS